MTNRYTLALLGLFLAATAVGQADSADDYTPQPVFCADGSDSLCARIPSFIGPDPAVTPPLGYKGLSNDVHSAREDVQTPFDNMAWQMFVALNWQAGKPDAGPREGLSGTGETVWQSYDRPEDIFGGSAGSCSNPKDLPRFNLISKDGSGQSRDEEFLQATGQPLIDINGNWTLFERRLNDIERGYITSHALDSLAGQKVFVDGGGQVQFPRGEADRMDGQIGAIEIKASWRIINDDERDRYFSIQGLLDVEGDYVSDGDPLCREVTLGLVGLHIFQFNPPLGALRAQGIWASFEHQGNSPLAAKACDATDGMCYKTLINGDNHNDCPAPPDSGSYSYHNPECTGAGTNVPPKAPAGDEPFVWQREAPYASAYTTQQGGTMCGTQVARCWKVYSLTRQLNQAWQKKLDEIDSVFSNYFLIGTNWGANIEPGPGELDNGSVPAFLVNSTMETYIQSNPQVGNCVNCHSNATLAYEPTDGKGNSRKIPSDFSFLPGLADRPCTDIKAGPIWNNQEAESRCPGVCEKVDLNWNGQWTTTKPAEQSVCGCCLATSKSGATGQ